MVDRFSFRALTHTRDCPFCGVTFTETAPTYRHKHKYCPDHRSKYHYSRVNDRTAPTDGFEPTRPGKGWRTPLVGQAAVYGSTGNPSKTGWSKYD